MLGNVYEAWKQSAKDYESLLEKVKEQVKLKKISAETAESDQILQLLSDAKLVSLNFLRDSKVETD